MRRALVFVCIAAAVVAGGASANLKPRPKRPVVDPIVVATDTG